MDLGINLGGVELAAIETRESEWDILTFIYIYISILFRLTICRMLRP